MVRWILQEAAQTAKRSPRFADTYGQLARRRGGNVATVAIARRLLARSFHILTQLEAAPAPEKARPGALASCMSLQHGRLGWVSSPARTPPSCDPAPGSEWCMRVLSATLSGPSRPRSCAGPRRRKVLPPHQGAPP